MRNSAVKQTDRNGVLAGSIDAALQLVDPFSLFDIVYSEGAGSLANVGWKNNGRAPVFLEMDESRSRYPRWDRRSTRL